MVCCALGAYQPTSVVLLFDGRPPTWAAIVLEFPTFESTDGKTLTPARTRELAGEITWLENAAAFVVLSLARQIGDCGTWARCAFADGAPKLPAFAAQPWHTRWRSVPRWVGYGTLRQQLQLVRGIVQRRSARCSGGRHCES